MTLLIQYKRIRILTLTIFLFITCLHLNNYLNVNPSLFYKLKLKEQDNSKFNYFKFRNISNIIQKCEQFSTVDCLNYLRYNQSDYFQSLSTNEYEDFQQNYCTHENKMLFHTFWNDLNRLEDPLLLLHIQSHLYTQNRQCSHLIIWLLPSIFNHIDSKYNVHVPHLQFRTLEPFAKDLKELDINIESYWSLIFGAPFGEKLAVVSDAVRFVVLHRLGGMYIDADVLLLRDLQPFYEHEFAYRWSYLDEFNTAILRLYPQSLISKILIGQALQVRSSSVFFPTSIRTNLHPTKLNRFPSNFFDPLWLAADKYDMNTTETWKLSSSPKYSFERVFRKHSIISRQWRTIFNGAFAFHWHSLHKAGNFEKGSYMDQWNRFYQSQLFE